MTPLTPKLSPRLVALCEDAFFAVASMWRVDADALHALAARRLDQKGAPPQGMDAGEAWSLALCIAMAPIAPPRWLPMAEAIEAGLSLEHGARGLRGFFTSKPSEKEVQRVRDVGGLAVRALGAVLAAGGTFRLDARALRSAFIASLGLPEADAKRLDQEEPQHAELIEVHGEVDAKTARGIVRGAFFAAMYDGLDPREEVAVLAIARKLSLAPDEVNAARDDAKGSIDASKGFGEAIVEAIRYVLEHDKIEAERFAIAAARLVLPAIHRREAVTAINVGAPVALGKRHAVDKKQREAVLALAWIATLRVDPTFTDRCELGRRLAAVAKDLGASPEDARDVRTKIEAFVETELGRA